MENKETDYINNNTNLLITMYSCAMVPLLAHLMDLCFKDKNTWNTEKLLLLYLASISGCIISEKIYRLLRNSKYYNKGFKLGNSDAMGIAICMAINSLVVTDYESIVTTLVLLVCMLLSIIILSRDINEIHFNYRKLICIGIFTMAYIIIDFKRITRLPLSRWVWYVVIQFIVCVLFDLVVLLINRNKESSGKGE